MTLHWENVANFAASLPDSEASTHYRAPTVKVRGNAFVATGHEPGSFCLLIDRDTVDMLKDTDPATYWQSAHYEGWPAVLVRYDSRDQDRVFAMIERAHAQAVAKQRSRARTSSTGKG